MSRIREVVRSAGRFQWRRTLRLVWQSSRKWMLANAIFIVVLGFLPLLELYLLKLIVDAVTQALETPDKEQAFRHVLHLVALAGATAIVRAVCQALAAFVRETQADAVSDHVLDLLHAKSIEIDLEYYENSQYYDALHRAQQDAPYRPSRIINGLVELGQSVMTSLAILALLFSFHWGIASALVVATIPSFVLRLKHTHNLYDWQRRRTPTERRAAYFNSLLTRGEHAKEIRLFNLGSVLRHRFRNERRVLNKEVRQIRTRRTLGELISQVAGSTALFGALMFVADRAIQGILSLGQLIMYYQAFMRGQDSLWRTFRAVGELYENQLYLTSLFQFLDLKPKVVETKHPLSLPKAFREGIAFREVSFHYPTSERLTLDRINLVIEPGQHVALVGENGSGKTTLVKLLCRLYDPDAGTITLDGIDIRNFDTTTLRREISVVFQDYSRYQVTAKENIGFGDALSGTNQQRVEAAARNAGVHEIISRLPHGYETTLGKWFEEGQELSIGEWQKIALARAFLRDAQILVLDEPTSALDPKAEHDVFARFNELAQGRTAILISHRLSTVRMADRIFVLANGRIAESGTHEELMTSGGIYSKLFETQASLYR